MSTFNREKVPAYVYRYDDIDAPQIPQNATTEGAVRTIIKACLGTGYGEKIPAGWNISFEDLEAGVTVLSTADSAEQKFYLRLSGDDGKQITPQVYFDMTDKDTGDLKLQCATTFKYATAPLSGEWLLIATSRGFWLFIGHTKANGKQGNLVGSYIYCGDTVQNTVGKRAIFLKHTGGTWGFTDDDREGLFSQKTTAASTPSKLLIDDLVVEGGEIKAMWQGDKNQTTNALLSQLYIMAQNEIYQLPAFAPSRFDKVNYDVIQTEEQQYINHGHGLGYGSPALCNLYIPMDFWWL